MECIYCKSSWNSSVTVANCPFCGKRISADTDVYLTLPEGISNIISEYGIEILNDSRRLIALIMDYVTNCDKEKKLFRIACNCGVLKIIGDIIASTEKQRDILIKKAVKKLEDEAFFSTDNAEYIISLILAGVGVTYKNEKEKIQDLQSLPAETAQTANKEEISGSIRYGHVYNPYTGESNNKPYIDAGADSTDEYYRIIVFSNAESTKEDRDAICEIGRKKLTDRSFDEGYKYVQYAAKRGSVKGMILAGYCCDVGWGVKQNKKIAETYYRQAAASYPEFRSYYLLRHGIGRKFLLGFIKRILENSYQPARSAADIQEMPENGHADERKG